MAMVTQPTAGIGAAVTVTTFGLVRELNTQTDTAINPDAESWSAGDELWLHPTTAGGLTNDHTKITAGPYRTVRIGWLLRDSATVGVIFVNIKAIPGANGIFIDDAGGLITATNVEAALQENRTAINLNTAKVTDKRSIAISVSSDRDVDLAVNTGAHRIPITDDGTLVIKKVWMMIGTAPTGSSIIADVNKNGTTIFTTQGNRPAIAAAAFSSGEVTNMDVTTLTKGDYITVDIDQIGSTVPGQNIVIRIDYEVTP